MSIETNNPKTTAEKVEAVWNLVNQMTIAHRMGDDVHFNKTQAKIDVLLNDVIEDLKGDEEYLNNPKIQGWIEVSGNEKLFNEMAKKNCPCRFADGSSHRFNDKHPLSELTHFKLV